MKEDFVQFVVTGEKFGIKPEFKVVEFSEKKGRVKILDGNGYVIEGKRKVINGFVKWQFEVTGRMPVTSS
jgi:hypothetical protein